MSAARHLAGMAWPDLALPATDGASVQPVGRSRPHDHLCTSADRPARRGPADGLGRDPGRAAGCTPQSCGFRDHFDRARGAWRASLYGLSTQVIDDQREVAARLHLPFALLSDARLENPAQHSICPTFGVDGNDAAEAAHLGLGRRHHHQVFYPVFPPDRSAAEVIAWLRASG